MQQSSEHARAIESIRAHYIPQVIHAEAASREYAQLALRSVITLNAGVAVAYPAVAEVFLTNAGIEAILWPTMAAILGVVLGVICAYLAYFNHGYEANVSFTEMELEVVKADEFFDQNTYWTFQAHRNKTKEHWENWRDRYDGRRDLLFYVSNAVGIGALACFGVSVIWFAVSVSSFS